MKEACPELLGSWVYSGHEKGDCVHGKSVINSYVATIETGRKHEVLLDQKNWGFCVRGEVATGGREQPEARRRARGTENAVSSTHWRFLMHKREWRGFFPKAKGRKDRGEDVSVAAVRETFEETGYPCQWLPLDPITRAPKAGAQTKDAAVPVPGGEESFMLKLRRMEDGGGQVHLVVGDGAASSDIQADREVIAKVVDLVHATAIEDEVRGACDTQRSTPMLSSRRVDKPSIKSMDLAGDTRLNTRTR
ncbi:hypothetical protein EDB83DRAFT_2316135 [Lactarius deliciosus]|nr:hypothetical protein EDB83DRAFT_2316135 [Lactarius deliciosus]